MCLEERCPCADPVVEEGSCCAQEVGWESLMGVSYRHRLAQILRRQIVATQVPEQWCPRECE